MKEAIYKSFFKQKGAYLFLILACVAVYWPVLENDFLDHWDDQWIVMNHYTEGGWTWDNLKHIFIDYYGGQYAPVMELSFLALYTFFGYDAFFFHLASLLWHIGCVCLVWKLTVSLLHLRGGMAGSQVRTIGFVTALLLAIHPVNVESVAWISAAKVLIYSFFYLLGLLCYVSYLKSRRFCFYLLALVCFVSSFFGKEQAVTFPLVLLLIDWFLNRNMRSGEVWSEKIIFLVMSLFFGLVTIFSQGISLESTVYPLSSRLVFAPYALIEYFTKSVFPVNLNYLYPFPCLPDEAVPARFYIYPVILLCLIGWLWGYRKNKVLIFGIGLFIINLLVAIHIIPMARHAIVADRYLYLSYIGISFLIGYGITLVKPKIRKITVGIFVLYCLYLAGYAFMYSQRWKNTDTVKQHVKEIIMEREDQK